MRKISETAIIGAAILAFVILGGRYQPDRFVEVSKKALQATVSITVDGKTQDKTPKKISVMGAGAFISPNGHVLTCAHLFKGFYVSKVTIKLYSGEELRGDILYVDVYRDLALVKVIKRTPFLKLGRYEDLKIGQEVLALGSPLGLEFTVTHGIISQLDRYELTLTNMVQTDVSSNPGNSGGPLINLKGEIIGVNTMMVSQSHSSCGLNFAQSIKEIRSFLARFKGIDQCLL